MANPNWGPNPLQRMAQSQQAQVQNQSAFAQAMGHALRHHAHAVQKSTTISQRSSPATGGGAYYISTANTTTATTTTPSVWGGSVTSNSINSWVTTNDTADAYYNRVGPSELFRMLRDMDVDVDAGQTITLRMPDGSQLFIEKGNVRIEDKDAKVTYKANRLREFNRYLNASDLLEDFIKFVGTADVSRGEFLKLPVELFIKWLVVEAARADGEPVEEWEADLHKNVPRLLPPP
jgi:hypothetical protein